MASLDSQNATGSSKVLLALNVARGAEVGRNADVLKEASSADDGLDRSEAEDVGAVRHSVGAEGGLEELDVAGLLLGESLEALADARRVASLLEVGSRELLEDVGVEVALEVLEGQGCKAQARNGLKDETRLRRSACVASRRRRQRLHAP